MSSITFSKGWNNVATSYDSLLSDPSGIIITSSVSEENINLIQKNNGLWIKALNSGNINYTKYKYRVDDVIYGNKNDQYIGKNTEISGNGNIIAISSDNVVKIYNNNDVSWNQFGQDISSNDIFTSIALSKDGSTLAISSSQTTINGNLNAGQIKIYKYNDISWNKIGQDINGDSSNNFLGNAISINEVGNIISFNLAGVNNNGNIKIYKYNDISWNQLGQTITGVNDNDNLGFSLSLNNLGNIIAIGIPGTTESTKIGSTQIYKYNDVSWNQLGEDINGENNTDKDGYSVKLNNDGTLVVIGAPYNSKLFSNCGKVTAYKYTTSANSWSKNIDEDIYGDQVNSFFGKKIAIDGSGIFLAIGTPNYNNNSGRVAIYKYDSIYKYYPQWSHYTHGQVESLYGSSLSLTSTGNVLAIGSPITNNLNVPHFNNGQITIYYYDTIPDKNFTFVDTYVPPPDDYHIEGEVTIIDSSNNYITQFKNVIEGFLRYGSEIYLNYNGDRISILNISWYDQYGLPDQGHLQVYFQTGNFQYYIAGPSEYNYTYNRYFAPAIGGTETSSRVNEGYTTAFSGDGKIVAICKYLDEYNTGFYATIFKQENSSSYSRWIQVGSDICNITLGLYPRKIVLSFDGYKAIISDENNIYIYNYINYDWSLIDKITNIYNLPVSNFITISGSNLANTICANYSGSRIAFCSRALYLHIYDYDADIKKYTRSAQFNDPTKKIWGSSQSTFGSYNISMSGDGTLIIVNSSYRGDTPGGNSYVYKYLFTGITYEWKYITFISRPNVNINPLSETNNYYEKYASGISINENGSRFIVGWSEVNINYGWPPTQHESGSGFIEVYDISLNLIDINSSTFNRVCIINEPELDTHTNVPSGKYALNKQPGTSVSINGVGDIIAIGAPKMWSFFDSAVGPQYMQNGWIYIYKITKK